MKSSFCIDLQRFMLIPTKFPLTRDSCLTSGDHREKKRGCNKTFSFITSPHMYKECAENRKYITRQMNIYYFAI